MGIAFSVRKLCMLQIVPCGLAIMSGTFGGCSKPSNSTHMERTNAPKSDSSGEPSREDLIEAVRKSVEAKNYSESVPQSERRSHTCNQYDVDADPNAKNNPELARCPRVGATYWTTEPIYVNQSVHCQSLPGPQLGWTVNQRTSDSWLVSYSGSAWDVSKVEGTSVNQNDSVRVSKFSFFVTAHQKC